MNFTEKELQDLALSLKIAELKKQHGLYNVRYNKITGNIEIKQNGAWK